MESAKDKVRDILSRFEEARNDDLFLILKYWQEMDSAPIDVDLLWRTCTPAETIRRARQKIQETEFQPTNPAVKKKREMHK